jgi:hypothetical protein
MGICESEKIAHEKWLPNLVAHWSWETWATRTGAHVPSRTSHVLLRERVILDVCQSRRTTVFRLVPTQSIKFVRMKA